MDEEPGGVQTSVSMAKRRRSEKSRMSGYG